jgi:hypothetical protein
MLENLSTARLADLSPRYVSFDQFRKSLTGNDSPRGEVLLTPLSLGGAANARILRTAAPGSEKAAKFREDYYKFNHHLSPPQDLILINQPCYLVVGSGTVFLEDRRLLLDTVYPSSGEQTLNRLIGSGINENNMGEELDQAIELADVVWSPLLSRWSAVYFHAITESMAHDAALSRSGLSPLIHYIVPFARNGIQELILGEASAKVEGCASAVVKVPRLLLSSQLYRHSVMGVDFLNFVEQAKLRALLPTLPSPKTDRVYVSRRGAKARQMLNEPELAAALAERGFETVDAETLSFADQVRAYSNAQYIVGAHGAGLVNAAFARPGATLFELRPLNRAGQTPMWGMSYLKLSSIMGYGYCAHVSENPPDAEEWTAEIDEILAMIDGQLA